MISEISQSQKDKYCMIPLNMRYLDKFIETESINRMIVTKGWVEEGEMESCCLMATEFQGLFFFFLSNFIYLIYLFLAVLGSLLLRVGFL